MGCWGTGNFDSDQALDFLHDVREELYERARRIATDDARLAVDHEGESAFVPLIAILLVLQRELKKAPDVPSEELVVWKEKYLKVLQTQMPCLADDEFVAERCRVVGATFDELIGLAREFEERGKRTPPA